MDRKVFLHENAAAHVRLIAKVRRRSDLISFLVIGGSADMTHQEPGLGITFPTEDEALEWGRDFEQRAVFWIDRGMLWLVPCNDEPRECLGEWQARIIPPSAKESGDAFQLDSRRWYSMHLCDNEEYYFSFIRVDAVQTSGKKNPRLKLSFFHQSYTEGVQDKVWKLEVLHRTRHLLAARSLEQDCRVVVITHSAPYRPSPDAPLIPPPGRGDDIELTP